MSSERTSLLALLKSTQALLEQQNARVVTLERARTRELSAPARPSGRSPAAKVKAAGRPSRRAPSRQRTAGRKNSKARKPK
jgi:hypothetical protein